MATQIDTQAPRRLLVLEDDPFQRQALVTMLRSMGHRSITGVVDGHTALAAISSEGPFEIAICDLQMAGMDGLEFIRRVAKGGADAVIVASVVEPEMLAYVKSIARSHGVPVLGVLNRPFLREQLGELIDRFEPGAARSGVAAREQRRHTSEELKQALDRWEFTPFFQPKAMLATGRIVGAEALCRWAHPQRGLLQPDAFIDGIEFHGLSAALGARMFTSALPELARWLAAGFDVGLSLNASRDALEDTQYAQRIQRESRTHNIAPARITIEVTETAFVEDEAGLLETLTRLRMNGFGVSIDDYGIGYSSLGQLRNLPFTELKIDRSFVSGAAQGMKAQHILGSTLELAAQLRLSVVVEGIETEDERALLQSLGCTVGQGYLFGRPMTGEAFLDALRANAQSHGT